MNKVTTVPLFSAISANAGIDFLTPLKRVIDSHWYILGNEIVRFEQEFSQYIGSASCITVANGTDALELSLRGLGVEAGDLVVTVANAGFYGSTAIHSVGAVPLYVDVDDETLTMSPISLATALAQKPKAVIVTHLYGQLANIEELLRITDTAGVPLIEDCAQAHGAAHKGKMAGSFGAVGCFSFYPTKNLGAIGDGGAIVTNNQELATRIRMLRQYGWSQKYNVTVSHGRNSRLDELQAAILREKLPHLDDWNTMRREIAQSYNDAFSSLPIRRPPSLRKDYVAHLYVIRVNGREAFRDFLKTRSITTDVHYPIPDHKQPAYQCISHGPMDITETACNTVVSLPCYPGMQDEEVARVIAAVEDYFHQ